MTEKKKRLTARELKQRLHSDPEWVATRAREEEERARRRVELDAAEVPLVRELRDAGVAVGSVWDLVNTAAPYGEAVPILLRHLRRRYPPIVREGIARALAVPEARHAWGVLTGLYRHERDKLPKDGLAVAIAAIANERLIDDVISLICDARNGPSRVLLLGPIARSRSPRAQSTLIELRGDPDLEKEISAILRRRERRKKTQRRDPS